MKIFLHGACSFPFFYKHLIPLSSSLGQNIEWHVILLSWRHVSLMEGVLPPERIHYIQPEVNRTFEDSSISTDLLSNYPGSIYKAIAADKGEGGQLRLRDKDYQLRNALSFYVVYKELLLREKPDCVVFPIIETHEAMIAYDVTRELNIRPALITSARNMGVSFFSEKPTEDLPPYAWKEDPGAACRQKAKEFVDEFQKNPKNAVDFTFKPAPEEIVAIPPRLSFHPKDWLRVPRALQNYYRDRITEPHSARYLSLEFIIRLRISRVFEKYWGFKQKYLERCFDLLDASNLPLKYIFFPLQVTPESSINSLEPFYVDQLRAIDMLLFNMPSDFKLVVKEHPTMKGLRSADFYRELKKRAGVILVGTGVNNVDLIKRSALVVSVSGTTVFEALLLNKPSASLSRTFFSPWVCDLSQVANINESIRNYLQATPDKIHPKAVDCVAHILSVAYNQIYLVDPYSSNGNWEYTMNKTNMVNFLTSLADHLSRSKSE